MSSYNFNSVPTINKSRTKFDLSHSYKATFDMGQCIPVLTEEVLPGDTLKDKLYYVIRTTTPFIRPIMDNFEVNLHVFFTPTRLCFPKFAEFMGENKTSEWYPKTITECPTASGDVCSGTIFDYMGVVPGTYNPGRLNACPVLAYDTIYNEWYRNENTQKPIRVEIANTPGDYDMNIAESESDEIGGSSPEILFSKPFRVNKRGSIFSRSLPNPQKGLPVELPLGTFAPVVTGDPNKVNISNHSLKMVAPNTGTQVASGTLGFNGGKVVGGGSGALGSQQAVPGNLVADLSQATASSVNDLRFAFQLQKMLEADARNGTRLTEIITSRFSVLSPDARMQRPEYITGITIPFNVSQVASMQGTKTTQYDASGKKTGTTVGDALGTIGGIGQSTGSLYFSKGVVEYGYINVLMSVRQIHTSSQNVPKMFTRTKSIDIYNPVFANIGEQPIYQSEIAYANDKSFDKVFGYNEAWVQYRYHQNEIVGGLRANANNGLDIWHLGDKYNVTSEATAPILSAEWCKETSANIDRCLSAPSTTIPNFVVDIWHDEQVYRELPPYSVPGLIDHH